jgi:hypothetical protein
MEALTRVVKRRAYNACVIDAEQLEHVCDLFLVAEDGSYMMRDVAKIPHFLLMILYSWGECIRADSDWCPCSSGSPQSTREFSNDVEQTMTSFIRINFVAEGMALTRTTLQLLVLMLVRDFVAQNVLDESQLALKCSCDFLFRFLEHLGLSFRWEQPERRPPVDDTECSMFLNRLSGAFPSSPRDLIFNFDESSWHLVLSGDQTVAERRVEAVHQCVNGDAKASFAFFATISAVGRTFPLILLAKGKTARYHKQLEVHPGYSYDVWHSPSGW